jgi:hypothetical protein
MDTLESSKRVLRRGRVQNDRRDEEAETRGEIPMHLASAEERQQMIAVAAYFRAQGRNFEPGRAFEDWLAAEAQIDDMLSPEA